MSLSTPAAVADAPVATRSPLVLDGVAIAAGIKSEVALEVAALAESGIRPGLAVILVGHVPASEIYVRSKVKTCGELGIYSEMLTPPETITTEEMLALVAELNAQRRPRRSRRRRCWRWSPNSTPAMKSTAS